MSSRKPNIVVLIRHDLGQHVGCYGAPDVHTPNIDALAREGTRFTNSFCTAPQCSPSRAALWTGRFPHANGVVGLTHGRFANDLNDDEVHLAQLLSEGGYDTHLFGVQHETSTPERLGYGTIHSGGPAHETAERAAAFFRHRPSREKPVFASIGFFEPRRPFPHDGFVPADPDSLTVPSFLPDIPVVREDLAQMGASIAALDRAVGRIVSAVRESDDAQNTLIIMTADHGIPFPGANMTLYDKGLEVPFIVTGPGIRRAAVLEQMISNVDVMPTLLEVADLPLPENLHGRSFLALLNGDAYEPRRSVFAEKTYHTYYDPMRCVRTQRHKVIANFENAPYQESPADYLNNAKGYPEIALAGERSRTSFYHPPIELYDLENDPDELTNLAEDSEYREIRDDLIRELRGWMEETGDALLDGPIPQGAYVSRMGQFKRV